MHVPWNAQSGAMARTAVGAEKLQVALGESEFLINGCRLRGLFAASREDLGLAVERGVELLQLARLPSNAQGLNTFGEHGRHLMRILHW